MSQGEGDQDQKPVLHNRRSTDKPGGATGTDDSIVKLTRRMSDGWGRYAFGALICLLFFYIISPFIIALTMGAVMAILFQPLMRRVQKARFSTPVSAAIVTLAVTFLIIIPTGYVAISGAVTGAQELGNIQKLIAMPDGSEGNLFEFIAQKNAVRGVLQYVEFVFNVPEQEIVSRFVRIVKAIGNHAALLLGEIVTRLPAILMSLTVTVVGMFFLLQDGHKLIVFMRRYSAMNVHNTERVILAFGTMARSVILATVVSAAVQTTVFSMTCVALGLGSVAVITLSVFIASFFPLVGSTLATIPVAGYQFVVGNSGIGLVLLLVGLLVTVLDNIVRPAVLKGSADLHPLLAFVAAIGGIQVLGVAGVFLGPIIAGVFIVTLKIMMDPGGRYEGSKRSLKA